MRKLSIMVLVVTILLSLLVVPASAIVPTSAIGQNIVNVSNVEQLEAALASNTKIVLAPGKYVYKSLRDDGSLSMEYNILRITDLENLSIEGNGKAEIVLDHGFAPVISVSNSKMIHLNGLILGHDVPFYGCDGEGNVIDIADSSGVYINNCDLYGCGAVGIKANGDIGIYVSDTTIRDCMINAVDFYYFSGNAVFTNCVFSGNAYDAFYAKTWPCLKFQKAGDTSEAAVKFKGCTFKDNFSRMFMSDEASAWVTTEACSFSNNVWTSAIHIKKPNHYSPDSFDAFYFDDQEPIIVNGRTLVPLRGVLDQLGYSVEWDGDAMAVTISKADVPYSVVVTIGSNKILKGDTEIIIDVPATIINDRTMVPIRAIAEAFELKVEWDDETRSVIIYPN